MKCLERAVDDIPEEDRKDFMPEELKVVQSGVSGSVFRTKRKSVVKFPVRPSPVSNAALMAEEFMLKILHCEHVVNLFQKEYPLDGSSPGMMIVRPKRLLRTKLSNASAVGMEMESLDLTLRDCLQKEREPALVIKDIFVQLFAGMHALWSSRRFMHRDLHASNVMLQRLPKTESRTVGLKGEAGSVALGGVLELPRKYAVRIIDVGISCFKAGGNHIELPTPYSGYTGEKDQCISPSFDCQYLLMHLVSVGLKDRIPGELRSRVESLQKLTEKAWGKNRFAKIASDHHKTIALLNRGDSRFTARALLGCLLQGGGGDR
jgi:serine/threonine protein kinase